MHVLKSGYHRCDCPPKYGLPTIGMMNDDQRPEGILDVIELHKGLFRLLDALTRYASEREVDLQIDERDDGDDRLADLISITERKVEEAATEMISMPIGSLSEVVELLRYVERFNSERPKGYLLWPEQREGGGALGVRRPQERSAKPGRHVEARRPARGRRWRPKRASLNEEKLFGIIDTPIAAVRAGELDGHLNRTAKTRSIAKVKKAA